MRQNDIQNYREVLSVVRHLLRHIVLTNSSTRSSSNGSRAPCILGRALSGSDVALEKIYSRWTTPRSVATGTASSSSEALGAISSSRPPCNVARDSGVTLPRHQHLPNARHGCSACWGVAGASSGAIPLLKAVQTRSSYTSVGEHSVATQICLAGAKAVAACSAPAVLGVFGVGRRNGGAVEQYEVGIVFVHEALHAGWVVDDAEDAD